MMMGEAGSPVELYYWRNGKGFQVLDAHGRSSVEKTSSTFQGSAQHDSESWRVVLAIPNVTPETPLCFALWDGAMQHRDGLKYFSLWYEVE